MHSFSHAHCLAAGGGRRSCLALYGSASGSGLRSPYASSPTHQAVSCSTLLYLWTGSSSPVASHPAFRRRSFLRLRTASVLSDGDFHPTVGAHSQAHVGTRSCAIRRGMSKNVPRQYLTCPSELASKPILTELRRIGYRFLYEDDAPAR